VTFVVASTAVADVLRAAPCTLRVAAVMEAAVYLEPVDPPPAGPGQGWLALLAADAVRVPIGLVTAERRCRLPFAAIAVGDLAVAGGGGLRLGTGTYRPLRYVDPAVPRLCGALATSRAARRSEALAGLLAALPPDDVRDWSRRTGPLQAGLEPALPPAAGLAGAVAALVGAGPGLTPAGDDVLAGALVTLAAAGDEPRRRALAAAVRDRLPATTGVSAALLEQACRGRAVPQVSAVLRALASAADLDAALARLALVGHTSGAALALGIRVAVRARSGRALGRCA